METPPGAHRAIGPRTEVRLSLRDQIQLAAVIIALTFAGAAWCVTLRRDVTELRNEVRDLRSWARRLNARVEGALGIHSPTAYGPTDPDHQDSE